MVLDNALTGSRIWDFLYFGYLPHLPRDWQSQEWAQVQRDSQMQDHPSRELQRLATESFEAGIRENASSLNVVLLSGGNDSRAILGALLKNFHTHEIVGVTYGTPGTTDFEIPRILAKKVGIRHVELDLVSRRLSLGALQSVANELLANPIWLFGAYANRLVPRLFGEEATYWSGYLGGPVTGSHTPESPNSAPWDVELARHADRPPLGDLAAAFPTEYSPLSAFPCVELSTDTPLTRAELVDLALRQYPFLRDEHVVPGYDYRLPFLYGPYLHVMFNAGHERRVGQRLYFAAVREAYPRLFNLPHKDHLGLRPDAGHLRRKVRAGMNYGRRAMNSIMPAASRYVPRTTNHLAWDQAFRFRADFRELAFDLLASLTRRNVLGDFSPDGLMRAHAAGRARAGMMIGKLIALELYMRAQME